MIHVVLFKYIALSILFLSLGIPALAQAQKKNIATFSVYVETKSGYIDSILYDSSYIPYGSIFTELLQRNRIKYKYIREFDYIQKYTKFNRSDILHDYFSMMGEDSILGQAKSVLTISYKPLNEINSDSFLRNGKMTCTTSEFKIYEYFFDNHSEALHAYFLLRNRNSQPDKTYGIIF